MAKKKAPGRVTCYISYNRNDSGEYVNALSRILTDRGMTVLYSTNTAREQNLTDLITGVVKRADVMILVATPEGLRSKWVMAEVDLFLETKRLIFPIILGDTRSIVIPPRLRGIMWTGEGDASGIPAKPGAEIVDRILRATAHLLQARLEEAVEAYIQIRRPQEKRPLNEGKLILVGRGEVGKTSLVKRLLKKTFRGDESKTQGINITTWSLQCPAETYRLNIWDFGGQEMMHSTHQFFLTEQSLYLLVLNGREGGEDQDAEYWLKHIESFGAGSPVIIVQNKIGQHPFELNYRGLQARYPQIRGFVKTDCKEKTGIDQLGKMIREAVEEMPEMRILFPADWFTVKERLESMKDEYMGYERFSELCRKAGIPNETDQDSLRWILHCLGIALNYRNDSRLRETSVLKPEWVTHGIYSILNAERLAKTRGELQLKDLQQILPKSRYPRDKHLFILELMRKFSLCFAFPDKEDRYLIPELLGKEEPEATGLFPPAACLNFEYHYALLPEGLMPRFIVKSNVLSRDQGRWRTGVILAHDECKALVTALVAEGKVIIRVKGGDAGARRNLLAIIRYDLDGIHAEFKDRLDAQAKVPLNDFPQVAIDYKKLVAFEKQGVDRFPEVIDQRVITVQVKELLNGVDLEKQREDALDILARAKSVFFCYSHQDETLRNELEVHLKLLQRQGVISTWHDRKILPGTEWDKEIDDHLKSARIILLLVSADLIASDYCWDIEIKRALERHLAGEATVIPVLLRECDWRGALFGKLQCLPRSTTPVTLYKDRDSAWTQVVKGIREVAEKA